MAKYRINTCNDLMRSSESYIEPLINQFQNYSERVDAVLSNMDRRDLRMEILHNELKKCHDLDDALIRRIRACHYGLELASRIYMSAEKNGYEKMSDINIVTMIQSTSSIIISLNNQLTPYTHPTNGKGIITSQFGDRSWDKWFKDTPSLWNHKGIDISLSYGDPIYAAFGGTIEFAGWVDGYGNMIQMRSPEGIVTKYAHLSRIDVNVGALVNSRSIIGGAGNTGTSTGTHLHFELIINDTPVNPEDHISFELPIDLLQ